MSTTAIVVIVVVGVLVIAAVGAVFARLELQRRQLRERFGPEYERTVGATGDTKKAEADLRDRMDLRERLPIRALSPAQRERYEQEWRRIQADFVDSPARSLERADALLMNVMLDRGYPMQDFDRQADLISVDHPQIVQNYRMAHGIQTQSGMGRATTEDIREAFVSYRRLFADLLADEDASSPQTHAA